MDGPKDMNFFMIFAQKNKFYLLKNLFLPRYQYTWMLDC